MGDNYRKGARFENRVKGHLEGEGYYAIRSAGSHGLADVVAFSLRHGEVMLIACRTDRSRYSFKEAHELWVLAKQQQALGVPAHAWVASRGPGPTGRWHLHMEQIDFEIWMPADHELPLWYEEKDDDTS